MDRDLFSHFVGRYRSGLLVALAASSLFNLLVFASSLYLMLVYDSVLPSRSVPTLTGLFAILVLLYVFQFVFDMIRSEALLTVANGVHEDLSPTVNQAVVNRVLRHGPAPEGDGQQPLRDLDQVHAFLSSSGPAALFDLPWVIVFLVILFALHWWLGLTALVGVAVLAAIAAFTNSRSQAGTREVARVGNLRAATRQAQLRFAEVATALGMESRLRARTSEWDSKFVTAQTGLGRMVARLGGAGRGFRLLLQSIILTVGALLVIDDKATGGVIIASSVLSGRALAPIDQTIANWRGLAAARNGWARIVDVITTQSPQATRKMELARPAGKIVAKEVTVVPPGSSSVVLAGVNLTLEPGQALAVIGPSASGKTSLAKALLGIWPAARGEIRIDGARHDQWDRDILGTWFGYVPQNAELMEGTVSQNIGRFDSDASSAAIMAAARGAAMHEAILAFPNGYETHLSAGGIELSAGQRQRVALARALYGDPVLLVLDEANSNLDAQGDAALAAAIVAVRARNGVVVMITHRPATLASMTHIAVLSGGRIVDFGEREAVLQRTSAQQGQSRIDRPVRVEARAP
ncbi:type I secretion system permease/ATPase [Novosphingobium lentum]|uniref:type I secretion system permease/ATPase n=1 Tax=Novosphingobium lentum TaxID=145287 RepID=UPI000829907A|nr:type I secretion system permease/ATPase [Novosphingobium lentum]